MKFAIILLILCSTAFAGEVSTDCQAMNGSREKIVKDSTSKKSKTTASQVASQ